jgi:elongation factor Ts
MPVPYLDRESVPAEVVEEEKAIIMAQLKNDPKNASKPENILEKMILGKIGKFYEKNCLIEQSYVKDDKLSVGKYVEATAKALNTTISIAEFHLFERGEGLQKKEEDFAAEIQKMVNGK